MASRYEVEVKLTSAKNLKNVNWRHGPNRPYAVVWVDPKNKSSTRVDESGDTEAVWDETLRLALPPGPIEDFTLYVDIVHAGSEKDTKPLIGSAQLKLSEVLKDAGIGDRATRSLILKRPSGRPQGKVEVSVTIKEISYSAPDPYYAPPYGVPPPSASRDYPGTQPAYGYTYGAPPRPANESNYSTAPPVGYPSSGNNAPPAAGYPSSGNNAPPPAGYPYSGNNAPPAAAYPSSGNNAPPPAGYPSSGNNAPPPAGYPYSRNNAPPPTSAAYGQQSYGQAVQAGEEKKSDFGGMGTGLAVGAVAGALGGIALVEGIDAWEDHIADRAAEKVEDDLEDEEDDFF